MDRNEYDIKDTEFRIIGQSSLPAEPQQKPRKTWQWILLGALALVVLGVLVFGGRSSENETHVDEEIIEDVVFEPMNEIKVPEEFQEPLKPLGDYSDTTLVKPYTEHLRDTINDIPIDIYIPHNAKPELMVGVPNLHDKSIILTTQAADIRADNGKIVGSVHVERTREKQIRYLTYLARAAVLHRKHSHVTVAADHGIISILKVSEGYPCRRWEYLLRRN